MQRVYWTVDLLEAHLVAGFLRARGIDATVFDADFVRQDWLAALAYGGYRVVTDDADAVEARRLIDHRRANDFALEEAESDAPACPRCGSHDVVEDAAWRRIASAILFVFLLPVVSFKWRCRCRVCGNTWKALPGKPYRDLAHDADAAETAR